MKSVNFGERLTQLRAIMAAKSLVPDHWSRPWLARETGVPLATLTQLEDASHRSAEVLAAVLCFYQAQGINLAWVLAPNNADIPLHGFRDILQNEQLPQSLADLRRLLPPLLAALDAGSTLPPEALHARLTQLQQTALGALNYLLPPKKVARTEADLRAYHKFFPPVPAQSTGWHPRTLFTVPYHYVDAGAFRPRCGQDVSFLVFNPVLEQVPAHEQCAACRSLLDESSPAIVQPQTANAL